MKKYDRSSLRVLGSVGEPISPAAWDWYYRVVGDSKCSIVDTYWQTETGADFNSFAYDVLRSHWQLFRWHYSVSASRCDAYEAWLVHSSASWNRTCPIG